MDLTEIAAGIGIVKTGFDAIRTALRLVKDVQGTLPAGEKTEAAPERWKRQRSKFASARFILRKRSDTRSVDARSRPHPCSQ
jgi:hypothetical protein